MVYTATMIPSAGDRSTAQRLRGFLPMLCGILLLGGCLRILQYQDYVAHNPFAARLIVDAQTYWDWAGRIAAGAPAEARPFFSAPLYPYFLGLLRFAGAELNDVYIIQIGLDLLTAALLAWLARLRFGDVAGLLAAVVYLLLLEPASFSLRVLACTPQLLLVVVALLLLHACSVRRSVWLSGLAGFGAGLYALTYPPAMVLPPVLAVGGWWFGARNAQAVGRAAVLLLGACVAVAPATWHNYRACGEFIPISAQAGLTFAHGNAPGAGGTYTKLPDVSHRREDQNLDAWRACERATGRTPTWNEVNRYFFRRGLEYWRSEPMAATSLLARKAWWFLSGRFNSEIYWPELEIEEGLTTRFRLTPLHTAWLTPFALIAAGAWTRRFREHWIELLFLALPAVVVIVFWYSPRYRLPALPVLVLAATYVLSHALTAKRPRAWRYAAVAGILGAGGMTLTNRAVGFDRVDPYRAEFRTSVGMALAKSERTADLSRAIEWYEKALTTSPNLPETYADLGTALARTGKTAEALEHLQFAVQSDPQEPAFHDQLGRVLAQMERWTEALEQFHAAVELNPQNAGLRNNLGNALLFTDNLRGAEEQYRIALALEPAFAEAHVNLGRVLTLAGKPAEADDHFLKAIRFQPELSEPQRRHGCYLIEQGRIADGVAFLRRAYALAPGDEDALDELAWALAVAPGLKPADRAQAFELARRAVMRGAGPNPRRLDTLAAAQAAVGRFDEAARTLNRGIALARQLGQARLAEQMQARQELYRAGKAYVLEEKGGVP